MFFRVVIVLLVVYGLVKLAIPAVSRQITGMAFPLTVPGTLVTFYMVLTIISLFFYVTFSEEKLEEFMMPVKRLLRGEYGKTPMYAVLIIVPIFVGWQTWAMTAPKVDTPVALRSQHPSSNFPKKMESLKNSMEKPSEAEVDEFINQAKNNEVEFIPQVEADIQAWLDMNPNSKTLDLFPTEPIKKFMKTLGTGSVDKETARQALIDKRYFEGRALYAMNCSSCHGASTAGDGPMADGFKLRPINFTDDGTIETIVEGYTFWRISNGGPGLPAEATPWDSAMPEWKLSLTEKEIWLIMMGEYNLAEKSARMLESHVGEGEVERL